MGDAVDLTLVLTERDPARIEEIASAVSAPDDPSFGRHLSRAELSSLVTLSPNVEREITTWLEQLGVACGRTTARLLPVRAPRDRAEEVFGRAIVRSRVRSSRSPLRLPPGIAGHIRALECPLGRTPASMAPGQPSELLHAIPVGDGRLPAGLAGASPADLESQYEFPKAWDGEGETIALMMLGGRLDLRDLEAFWTAHGIRPPRIDLVQVGPRDERPPSQHHTIEAAMTVEWAGAMAPGARLVVYCIDPLIVRDPFAAFLLAVIEDEEHAPTIACTSWTTPEHRYYAGHGQDLVVGLLAQAAAIGVTVIAATGDWGVLDGVPRARCEGRRVAGALWPRATFPSSEDRVLSVGGTKVVDRCTEIAWSGPLPPGLAAVVPFERLAGSGGFSDVVPIPSWQVAHLGSGHRRGRKTVIPYGRGVPDVALMASGPAVRRSSESRETMVGYRAVVDGQWIDYAGGTSVAAPIWAAIIARINQARRSAGRGRLGFANPALYHVAGAALRPIGSGATDVVVRALDERGRPRASFVPGYATGCGWSPATGLGVPRVGALIRALDGTSKP